MTIRESIGRANSHLRYWAYRRQIGRPISLLGAMRDWWSRFVFELKNAPSESSDV